MAKKGLRLRPVPKWISIVSSLDRTTGGHRFANNGTCIDNEIGSNRSNAGRRTGELCPSPGISFGTRNPDTVHGRPCRNRRHPDSPGLTMSCIVSDGSRENRCNGAESCPAGQGSKRESPHADGLDQLCFSVSLRTLFRDHLSLGNRAVPATMQLETGTLSRSGILHVIMWRACAAGSAGLGRAVATAGGQLSR